MATYKVKHISGETSTRQVPATDAEVYNQGELVYVTSGLLTEIGAATESVLGWTWADADTASTGDMITVEYPVGNDVIIEVYSDGALTCGNWYDINADGSVDSNATAAEIWTAVNTTAGAGMAKMKLLKSVLQN